MLKAEEVVRYFGSYLPNSVGSRVMRSMQRLFTLRQHGRTWLALGILVGRLAVAGADVGSDRSALMFERGRALAAQGNYDDACRLFERSFELDAALGTLLNLADCREHLGDLADARRLFTAALRQAARERDVERETFARHRLDGLERRLAIANVTIAGRAPAKLRPSSASRAVWLGMLIGGVGIGAAGVGMLYAGQTRIHEAERELCLRGGYLTAELPDTIGGLDCKSPQTPLLTRAEIEAWNQRGSDGRTLAQAGVMTASAGAGLAAVAAYLYFTRTGARDSAAVVPAVAPGYAGAVVNMRW